MKYISRLWSVHSDLQFELMHVFNLLCILDILLVLFFFWVTLYIYIYIYVGLLFDNVGFLFDNVVYKLIK